MSVDAMNWETTPEKFKKNIRTKHVVLQEKQELEGWRKVKLGEVAEIITGKTPPTKRAELFGTTYPFITPTDINENVRFCVPKRFLSEQGRNFQKSLLIPPNSICYTCIASIGKICITTTHSFTNQQINSVIANPNTLSYIFLFYALKHLTPNLRNSAGGTIAKIINKNRFQNFSIVLPPLPEQKAIASLLETWDVAIEKTEVLIAAKERQFQWLLKTLIGDQQDNPEWRKVKLGDILSYEQPTNYIVSSTNYANEGSVAVLTANKSFILGYTKDRDGIFNKYPAIIFDDFTTASRYVDFPFKIKSAAVKILMLADNNADLRFVYYSMQLINYPLGGHQRYWISEYRHLTIKLPSLVEQKRIVAMLEVSQKEIDCLKQLAKKYYKQKHGLMQKLLTGKQRVGYA